MKPEVGEMFEWMNSEGYQADVPALREHHPDLMSFEDWFSGGRWAGA